MARPWDGSQDKAQLLPRCWHCRLCQSRFSHPSSFSRSSFSSSFSRNPIIKWLKCYLLVVLFYNPAHSYELRCPQAAKLLAVDHAEHVPAALSSLHILLGLCSDINKRCCTTSNWNSSRRIGLKDVWHVTEREREAWENQQRTDIDNSKHRYTSTAWAAEGNFFLPALSRNYKWLLLFCKKRTWALCTRRNDVGLNTTKWFPVVSNTTKY